MPIVDVEKKLCSGDMYGQLMLTGKSYNRNGHTHVEYICACKKIRWTRLDSLITGNTKSCGCLSKYFLKKAFTKHGYHGHTLYHIWHGLKQRCYNPKKKEYPDYGGRGIDMCDEWLDVVVFCDWGIKNGWADGLTLERLDNNKGYSPDNCVFATRKVQSRNRRDTVRVMAFGEVKCLTEWASDQRCVVTVSGLRGRIRKGLSAESAITIANTHRNRNGKS